MRVHILRIRKGVPGVGRRLARWFRERGIESQEVVCGLQPTIPIEEGDYVVNYGRSQWPVWADYVPMDHWFNKPDNVANCVNKIQTLEILTAAGVPCLSWTTLKEHASLWSTGGSRVFARKQVTGSKGKGIIIVKAGTSIEDYPDAPLYTCEYPNNPEHKLEFRVHVMQGQVIDYVQKKRMSTEKLEANGYLPNEDVRNHANGWVFAHKNLVQSDLVRTIAVRAADALGVDFAGVDVIADYRDGCVVGAKVCEVNSAPNISAPTTIAAYMDGFLSQMVR